jgi:4-diphosphocytidyl-2-C-methyl-D-erythritol kinase
MSRQSLTLPAHAKVNLSLRVLGRRDDGYHEIRTIFQTISLADTLTFEPAEDGRLELACSDPDLPTGEGNLVYRAASALRDRHGVTRGARLTLEKRIPAQGGLGGGSSDAAVALVGLARLWQLETGAAALTELASKLGADVPFFLSGGTALGTGTGADVTPLADRPKSHLVVVAPAVKISTAEAYSALNAPALTKDVGADTLSVSRAESVFSGSFSELMRNDFEAVAERLEPEIARARAALEGAGARRAMLSGSGSSVFGLFDGEAEAGRAAQTLRGEAGWRVFQCATLSRAEYRLSFGECAALLLV